MHSHYHHRPQVWLRDPASAHLAQGPGSQFPELKKKPNVALRAPGLVQREQEQRFIAGPCKHSKDATQGLATWTRLVSNSESPQVLGLYVCVWHHAQKDVYI